MEDIEVILSSMLRSMQRDRYNFIREENKIFMEGKTNEIF